MPFFKSHPFAVEAYFERSVVLGFALPADALAPKIPWPLELDTVGDLGFVAAAMVRTRALRPRGFPRWLGRDFSLIGYRVFVRYRSKSGKRLRGLYILGSRADRRSMVIGGNLFTRYRYKSTDIEWSVDDRSIGVRSRGSGVDVLVRPVDESSALPDGSPFADWNAARRFAGPMPYTFSVVPDRSEVVLILGVRSHWDPRPLLVERGEVSFFEQTGLPCPQLANAFLVSDVSYCWERGVTERFSVRSAS